MNFLKCLCCTLFLLTYSVCYAIEPIWFDTPIAYKRHLEVQTYMIDHTVLGSRYYVSYVLDQRSGIIYQAFTGIEEHARIIHQQAINWIKENHATLRITIPENNEYINAPVPPSAPRSRNFPIVIPHIQENKTEETEVKDTSVKRPRLDYFDEHLK